MSKYILAIVSFIYIQTSFDIKVHIYLQVYDIKIVTINISIIILNHSSKFSVSESTMSHSKVNFSGLISFSGCE